MSAEQNEAIVRRIYKEHIDELDPSVADELLVADVVLHGVRAFGEGSGRENIKQGFSAFLSGFAERHTDVEDLITEGDRVIDDNLGMMQQMGVFPSPGERPGGTPSAGQAPPS